MPYTCIATRLDCTFSIIGGVVRSQTKHCSSSAKCTIGSETWMQVSSMVELINHIKLDFQKKNPIQRVFPKSSHIYTLCTLYLQDASATCASELPRSLNIHVHKDMKMLRTSLLLCPLICMYRHSGVHILHQSLYQVLSPFLSLPEGILIHHIPQWWLWAIMITIW